MNLSLTRRAPFASIDANAQRTLRSRRLLAVQEDSPIESAFDERSDRHRAHSPARVETADAMHPTVEISPANSVRRHALTGHGMTVEYIQCTSPGVVEYRFRAPVHLLVAYEQGECRDGETFVEGLPRSTLRSFARKLTFVPAGHEYRAWHEPRTKPNFILFYFDPTRLENIPRFESGYASLAPRLFFEDAALWPPILKLKSVVEQPASDDQSYLEAVGMVLILELARLNRGRRSVEPPVRGGLAPWQQRIVVAHIEQHFADSIPIAALAQLVRLSPHHFCRSFKRSFGKPPHRYQRDRRIERAKLLLARRAVSVTDVAFTVGFGSSSAFAMAFRKATGITPTAYQRS